MRVLCVAATFWLAVDAFDSQHACVHTGHGLARHGHGQHRHSAPARGGGGGGGDGAARLGRSLVRREMSFFGKFRAGPQKTELAELLDESLAVGEGEDGVYDVSLERPLGLTVEKGGGGSGIIFVTKIKGNAEVRGM